MIKILTIDDHAIVRKGLREIVLETKDMQVVLEASSGPEGLRLLRKNAIDVVLLDISMPGQNGLEILEQIKAEKPQLPVLILSMFPEEQYAVRALKLGASGYLTKDSAPDELISAIRTVSTGRKYVNASLAEKLVEYIGIDLKGPLHETLSNREFEVMTMIAAGQSVKSIAEKLSLSAKTISTHRARLLQKMHMQSNAELIRYVIEHDLTCAP